MSAPRVVAVLAQGGSGRVELAFRAEGAFRRMYAVKRLREGLAEDARVREHFLREAAITTRLRHPNVVSVLDVGADERGPYLVMDHVLGVSLRELREALGEDTMPAQLVWQLGASVARALHAVHVLADEDGKPLGLVHRDVTPGNVMVGYDGIVRLVDFGLARASDERTASLLQGTSGYLAPEQLRFEPVDGRADLFALGVILHELLHGRRLYGDADVRRAARRTLDEPLDALDASLDPAEEALLRALLAKVPSNRPADARETARRLEGLWRARVRREGADDVRRFLATKLEGRERRARARLAELWRAFDTPKEAPNDASTSAKDATTAPVAVAAPGMTRTRRPSNAVWIALAALTLGTTVGWTVWPAAEGTNDTPHDRAPRRDEDARDGIDATERATAEADTPTNATRDDAARDDAAPTTTESTPSDTASNEDTPEAGDAPDESVASDETQRAPAPRRRRRRPTRDARTKGSKTTGLWTW
ncbi:MAG: serine/threonine protein kinase [Sandaracinus sp.]|nr:serine/threonine protein kinase [Sandaracinus sp.]MCB9636146.1 serine/threonine protein kinase [Sandaracinus sp.]